jgi:hypothetical protein
MIRDLKFLRESRCPGQSHVSMTPFRCSRIVRQRLFNLTSGPRIIRSLPKSDKSAARDFSARVRGSTVSTAGITVTDWINVLTIRNCRLRRLRQATCSVFPGYEFHQVENLQRESAKTLRMPPAIELGEDSPE